jgi:hypothetical protein
VRLYNALSFVILRLTGLWFRDLNATEEDLREARELASRLTLYEIRPMLEKVLAIHEHDPNFPYSIIQRIQAFLGEFAFSHMKHYACGLCYYLYIHTYIHTYTWGSGS